MVPHHCCDLAVCGDGPPAAEATHVPSFVVSWARGLSILLIFYGEPTFDFVDFSLLISADYFLLLALVLVGSHFSRFPK